VRDESWSFELRGTARHTAARMAREGSRNQILDF
jgi:hypothetical protein